MSHTEAEVAASVQKHLNDAAYIESDISFRVDPAEIGRGDGWYRVPVHPSRLPARDYLYYGFLAEVNEQILRSEKINVLLFSADTTDAENGRGKLAPIA